MVHALEEIHRLLRKGGALIEIHPVRESPTIEIRCGDDLAFAEPDPGYDYEDDLRAAEEAVATVARRGLFLIDGERDFDLLTHARSVKELREFFAVSGAYDDTAKDETLATRQNEVYDRATKLLETSPSESSIVYRERGVMTRLTPISQQDVASPIPTHGDRSPQIG